MEHTVSTVVVSHNSQDVLPRCIDSLLGQTLAPERVFLVDSGSDDRGYLEPYKSLPMVTVIEEGNIGFGRANNRGFAQRPPATDFILFLNPDASCSSYFIERAVAVLLQYPEVGMVGGKIYFQDPRRPEPTNIFDSTGIFRKWYGRWYDRGQGCPDTGQFDRSEEVPSLCGAAMFCRCSALADVASGGAVFDPDFFLYKEDIELGIRLRKRGWKILYHPDIIAYHGRGWKASRKEMPFVLRRVAAESELLLYKKHPSPYMVWAILKYLLVRFVRA